jgi:hypothetical protein
MIPVLVTLVSDTSAHVEEMGYQSLGIKNMLRKTKISKYNFLVQQVKLMLFLAAPILPQKFQFSKWILFQEKGKGFFSPPKC